MLQMTPTMPMESITGPSAGFLDKGTLTVNELPREHFFLHTLANALPLTSVKNARSIDGSDMIIRMELVWFLGWNFRYMGNSHVK